MGELEIHGNRVFTLPQYQRADRAEKPAESGDVQSQKTAGKPGYTVSDTLQELMTRVSQAEGRLRESRRTLLTGESVLDEVQDSLGRMKELAREAAGGGSPDRAALQAELEQLREKIDRMLSEAGSGGTPLFLDEETGQGIDALLDAVMDEASGKQGTLPDWLMQAITQDAPSASELLEALGLDKNASGAELLAAIAGRSPESDPAAGYLAALYLGAVIAAGGSERLDPQQALEGLRLLLEKVSQGVPLDRAIEELTNGEFTSLADLQAQFTGGSAQGLEDFLTGLLLTNEDSAAAGAPLLALLAGMGEAKLDLITELLNAAASADGSVQTGSRESSVLSNQLSAQADEGAAAARANTEAAAGGQTTSLRFGALQVTGKDLSGVSFHQTTGELTVGGTGDVIVQGTGQGTQSILITGSGTVTLRNVADALLTVDAAMARIFSGGENTLAELSLREGASLTLGGGGLMKIGLLRADASNTLRLEEGAVAVEPREGERAITAAILLDSAVSLSARADNVSNFSGRELAPFDLVWKALLPGWSGITSMAVDGKQVKTNLTGGDHPDPVRLWLEKGDPNHGFTIHTLMLRGRDRAARLRTQYAYLRWSQNTGRFQRVSMYPNPFTVTGGEAGRDWSYEEESHTLLILTSQVTAISGGTGTDLNHEPFSGRVVLADGVGSMELTLDGVSCRVDSGRAFSLGRENDVVLLLQKGTNNYFESGAGFAGISLAENTSLCIDCVKSRDSRTPTGTLTAAGCAGGAGVGRDSGAGRAQTCHILIRGGVVAAAGAGGGAGIGAGKHGAVGSITITGGTVSAEASHHAAAIGAGVQGACGDILISGSARIVKALGGDPGADIGACLFGGCGRVVISEGADIGSAKLRTQAGVPLQMGEDTVMLPQFRLSSRTLRLDQLRVTTREYARAAKITIDAGSRVVAQVQKAYGALYGRLEESFSGLYSFRQYINVPEEPVRDTAAASTLLQDMRQSILLQSGRAAHSKRGTEDVRQLLR